MEENKKLPIKDWSIEEASNGTKTIDLISAKEFGRQISEIITGIQPEIRKQLNFSVLAQGPGLRYPNSGFGEIEIIPAKIQFVINPIQP